MKIVNKQILPAVDQEAMKPPEQEEESQVPAMDRKAMKSRDQMWTLVVDREAMKPPGPPQAEPLRPHRHLRPADQAEAPTSHNENAGHTGTPAQVLKTPQTGPTST